MSTNIVTSYSKIPISTWWEIEVLNPVIKTGKTHTHTQRGHALPNSPVLSVCKNVL